jgi:hypothetical protein
MPTTPNGLPYPAPGDAPDGAAQMKALAEALPAHRVPTAMSSHIVTVNLTNSTVGTAVVTFPVGRFASPPRVVSTAQGTSIASAYNAGGATASAITVGVRKIDGIAATISVDVSVIAVLGIQ